MATTVKATFTGEDGSCGYKNGKEYKLIINHTEKGRGLIEIVSHGNSEGYCTYNSMHAFMNNWDNVRNV